MARKKAKGKKWNKGIVLKGRKMKLMDGKNKAMQRKRKHHKRKEEANPVEMTKIPFQGRLNRGCKECICIPKNAYAFKAL